jgi:hypothetical protein
MWRGARASSFSDLPGYYGVAGWIGSDEQWKDFEAQWPEGPGSVGHRIST